MYSAEETEALNDNSSIWSSSFIKLLKNIYEVSTKHQALGKTPQEYREEKVSVSSPKELPFPSREGMCSPMTR